MGGVGVRGEEAKRERERMKERERDLLCRTFRPFENSPIQVFPVKENNISSV